MRGPTGAIRAHIHAHTIEACRLKMFAFRKLEGFRWSSTFKHLKYEVWQPGGTAMHTFVALIMEP
jgi:hypothetical protein